MREINITIIAISFISFFRLILSMFITPLRQKLQEKPFVLGTMITEIRNPLLIPLLIDAGFDFAIVDMEHATFTHYELSQFGQ